MPISNAAEYARVKRLGRGFESHPLFALGTAGRGKMQMPSKDFSLEAIRGTAALVVVLCHSTVAFCLTSPVFFLQSLLGP